MTKLIILDLYGVVMRGSYRETCQWLGKRYHQNWHDVYAVLYHKYFNKAAMGELSEKEFFTATLKELGMSIHWKAVSKKHLSFQTPNKGVLRLAGELQRRGYTVLVLSKNIPPHLQYLVKRYKLRKIFPHIINTYDLGLPKASVATMRYILKKFRVKPYEVLMTDDQDFNLVVPEKLGIRTHLYKNFPVFRQWIRRVLI